MYNNYYQQPNNAYVGGNYFNMNPAYANRINAMEQNYVSTLTPEEVNSLRVNKSGMFNFSVPKEEVTKHCCNHIDPTNGRLVVHSTNDFDKNGLVCDNCGVKWDSTPNTVEEGEYVKQLIVNIFNNGKMSGVIPVETQKQIFQLTPVVHKAIDLCIHAQNMQADMLTNAYNIEAGNIAHDNMLRSMTGIGGYSYGYPTYDQFNNPYQMMGGQQVYNNVPVFNSQLAGQYAQPMTNPMDINNQMVGGQQGFVNGQYQQPMMGQVFPNQQGFINGQYQQPMGQQMGMFPNQQPMMGQQAPVGNNGTQFASTANNGVMPTAADTTNNSSDASTDTKATKSGTVIHKAKISGI